MVDAVGSLAVWAHLIAAISLTGLIWCIQIVHYPLMDWVSPRRFEAFHHQHSSRIAWVVIPPMLVELAAACSLVLIPPPGVPSALPAVGLALVALIWISTFAVQVPLHRRLAIAFDDDAHRRLVRTNWVRTVAWSLRAAVAVMIALAS